MARRSGQSGTVVRKGLTWHGRFYQDVLGQAARVRRSVPLGLVSTMTKPEAKRKLRSLLEEQGINSVARFTETVRPGKTFSEAAAWWEENKLALRAPSYQDSRGQYLKTHLLPYFGTTPICIIGEPQAQEFTAHLVKHGLAPSTIESILSTLKVILGNGTRDWHLTLPRTTDAEQRYSTQEEMRKIVDAAEGKWKPFFALLGETGLRFGEAAGLHAEDLDFTNNRIHVRRSIYRGKETPTKTRAGTRTVDISPAVAQLLTQHLAGRTTGLTFPTKSGWPLSKDNTRRSLHRMLKRLGIPKGGLHAFRHGRVSLLQAAGVPGDLVKA